MPIARASMMVRICCLSRGTTLCDQRSGRSGNILYSRSASIGGTRSRRANGGGGKVEVVCSISSSSSSSSGSACDSSKH